MQKRPQDFENSVKFDENANVFMQKRPQVFENSVKVDENDNVFLEWFYWLYTFEYKYFNLDGKALIYL